ncbi:ATP-binding protein, partial [Chloroflexota bacterium]
GQKLDMDFVNHLKELGKTQPVTPCGEAGEYHTLVIDGPIFKKRLEITETRKALREGTRFLEILGTRLQDK